MEAHGDVGQRTQLKRTAKTRRRKAGRDAAQEENSNGVLAKKKEFISISQPGRVDPHIG
jgi:hypothetical protein